MSRRKFFEITSAMMLSNAMPEVIRAAQKTQLTGRGEFLHGVASGDPLQHRVIIWTRVTPPHQVQLVVLRFEVSLQKNFTDTVQTGYVNALKENDYTIKIDLQGLQQNSIYYYRFKTSNAISNIGKTQTLPVQTDRVTLAVFSCANYTNGYFNAYQDACNFSDRIHAVIHLGDYIYEQGMQDKNGDPGYATSHATDIDRVLPAGNDAELFTLSDYRRRYATYRSDPDLQALHRLYPFICIWDDHEVVDNAYRNGAKDYMDRENQAFRQRKNAALKAYVEWIPIRVSKSQNNYQINRSFNFGSLLSLHMLDTRLAGRDRQMDYSNYLLPEGDFDLQAFTKDSADPARKMIGDMQLQWLDKALKTSTAQWQIIGQQVRLSENLIPYEIVKQAVRYDRLAGAEKEQIKKSMVDSFHETTRIKARMVLKDISLIEKETERLKVMLPYNLDAWDGYATERDELYRVINENKKPVVVLSGDAHYAWANELIDKNKEMAGIELGVTSVSSPGIEEDYKIEDASLLEQLEKASSVFDARSLYANYRDRGYLIVEIDRSEVKGYWRYVNTVASRNYEIDAARNHKIRIAYKDGRYYYR